MHTEEKVYKTVRHPARKTDGKSDKILEIPFQGLLASTSVSFSDICVHMFVHLCMHACIQAFGGTTFAVLLVISVNAFLLLCIYSRLVLELLVALSQRQAVRK